MGEGGGEQAGRASYLPLPFPGPPLCCPAPEPAPHAPAPTLSSAVILSSGRKAAYWHFSCCRCHGTGRGATAPNGVHGDRHPAHLCGAGRAHELPTKPLKPAKTESWISSL